MRERCLNEALWRWKGDATIIKSASHLRGNVVSCVRGHGFHS